MSDIVESLEKALVEAAEINAFCMQQRDAAELRNVGLIAALRIAEKAIEDCLECRSHLNYEARRQVRAALISEQEAPDAYPADQPITFGR